MIPKPAVKVLSALLVSILSVTPILNTAQAGVISTEDALLLEAREAHVDEVRRLLAQTHVRDALVQYGVDPSMAAERAGTLTDTELMALESRLGELPAGSTGVVEVVGIVAIVLIVLELLGVTDVFKSI